MAYQTAAVYADPDRIDLDDFEPRLAGWSCRRRTGRGAVIRLPVLYDGPDLAEVARAG